MRIFISGLPAAGKTTLSKQFKIEPRHTDEFIDLEWSDQSDRVKEWVDDKDIQLIEGVALPRALRKWLDENESGKPCDILIWMSNPKMKLTRNQERMARSLETVMDEICMELMQRGVDVVGFGQDDGDEVYVF